MTRVMEKILKYWVRILSISLIGVCIWGFFRGFVFKKLIPVNDPAIIISYGDGYLVENGLFLPVLTIEGIIVLLLFSIFYVLTEEQLGGNRYIKGLSYGLSFYLIFATSFFEFYHIFQGKFIDAIFSGFADGLPLFITGILLGIFIPSQKRDTYFRPRKYLLSIIFISIIFFLGRIFYYTLIYPTPVIRQSDTYFYILLFGATVGFIYFILSKGISTNSIYNKSVFFGIMLAPLWFSGNLFICLKYKYPVIQMLTLSVIDIIMIIFSGLLTEFILKPKID